MVRSLVPVAVFPVRHPSICRYSGSVGRLDMAHSTGVHVFRAARCTYWVQNTDGTGCSPSCLSPVGTGIGIPLFG